RRRPASPGGHRASPASGALRRDRAACLEDTWAAPLQCAGRWHASALPADFPPRPRASRPPAAARPPRPHPMPCRSARVEEHPHPRAWPLGNRVARRSKLLPHRLRVTSGHGSDLLPLGLEALDQLGGLVPGGGLGEGRDLRAQPALLLEVLGEIRVRAFTQLVARGTETLPEAL